jgi:hypothetical protein
LDFGGALTPQAYAAPRVATVLAYFESNRHCASPGRYGMGFFGRVFGRSKRTAASEEEPRMVARLQGPGKFQLDIVGESNYQDSLLEICGGKTSEGHRKEVEAMILLDNGNPYDSNAVAVYIDGNLVGHLSRDFAVQYRKRMEQAGALEYPAACQALIVGGWDRGDGDEGHFGVKLDLPLN